MIELIMEDGELIGVLVNGNALSIDDVNDEFITAECTTHDIANLDISNFPDQLILRIRDTEGFGTFVFCEIEIYKKDGKVCLEFICNYPNKYWNGKYGLAVFLDSIRKQVSHSEQISIGTIELENDWKTLTLIADCDLSLTLNKCISQAIGYIKNIINEAEINLGGISWRVEYEQDESIFCAEILTPLFIRMGFLSVRYLHGKKEYGKDYTFSELTPFGGLRHYGLQAKSGTVSGQVNSDIDQIIGQIEDAFQMPYFELGAKEPRYISTFIIAISGHFTENAKEKIVEKMPKGVIGSVYFLDKERIVELIERYWLGN